MPRVVSQPVRVDATAGARTGKRSLARCRVESGRGEGINCRVFLVGAGVQVGSVEGES